MIYKDDKILIEAFEKGSDYSAIQAKHPYVRNDSPLLFSINYVFQNLVVEFIDIEPKDK